MKKIRIITAIALLASMVACNPIEDKSLRDDYITNAGTPVTSEELTSYLHVYQPYPNTETAVEGDQIVSLKNDRPEIGGVWHVVTSMGETILKSDSCTYTYESNGEFEVYYVALSAGKIVESAHFPITVTNVFDPWAGYLTGAKDKADRGAKKTWAWREVSWGSVCNMGAHGGWKYASAGYTPESNFCWWGNVKMSDVSADEKMVFEYAGSKMTTYNADGSVKATGTFGFNKEVPEDAVLGSLITTAPTIGARFDEVGQGQNNSFYLLTFDNDYITIFHKTPSSAMADWSDYGWYAYFKAVE